MSQGQRECGARGEARELELLLGDAWVVLKTMAVLSLVVYGLVAIWAWGASP